MKILIETKSYGTKEVFFDDEDYNLLKDYEWHIAWEKNNFYARCFVLVDGKYKAPRMHRMVMGVSGVSQPHIDHINHNGLDNRKANLRVATIEQNNKNKKLSKLNTSGYKGVVAVKLGNGDVRYRAQLFYNGRGYSGGTFKTASEAAESYNKLAVKYNGEFAGLNVIS